MNRLTILAALTVIVLAMWGLSFASKRMERVASGIAALPPVSFERPTLVTLGTGGTFENPHRLGPAQLVGHGESLLLVDAGRAVTEALRRAGVPAWQPTHVLLTSLQPENTLGLDDLLATGWHGPRETPLRVYGPPGTRALVDALAAAQAAGLRAQAGDWALPEAGGRIEAVEVADGQALEIGGLSVRVASLEGGSLPGRAYRIEVAGRSLVVTGTGVAPAAEALVGFAQGADMLLCEAVYGASLEAAAEAGIEGLEVLQREARAHLRLEDLGELATRAGVRSLVITRLRPPPVFDWQYERLVTGTFRGLVTIAADGLSLEIQ